MDRPDNVSRFECVLEDYGAAHQLRKEDAKKLAEDVAERQQVQEADGVYPSFVFEIFPNLQFERRNIGENVAVRNYDSLGLGGGAGSEDDFQRVRGFDLGGRMSHGRLRCQCLGQVFQSQGWDRLLLMLP